MRHLLTFFLLSTFLFCNLQLRSQVTTYPPDSLTTLPVIPRDAVKIPVGRATGPDARLAHSIYRNIRFPRTALTNRVGGKVLVYGVVDTAGVFQIDSAGLFQEQSVVVIGESPTAVKTQDILLGHVKEFTLKKKKWLVADAPKKWSKAQKDLVIEALRVARELPKFKPGTIRGRKVASYVDFPVVFRHSLDRF